jgi:hypothetical protein
MNYLTTYYKNLCEQLQSQLNNLQQNLQEAYVLDPSQIASAPMSLSGHQYRSRAQILGRGTRRADALGAMMSAGSYDGVNADERDAIARIIADTQGSAPERGTWEYQSFNAYRPGARAAGSQATGEHLKIALGAMRRLQNDPRFAEHHTSTVAAELPDAALQSAADADMYGKDPMGLTSKSQKYILSKAGRSATGLSPSTSVSDITQQFGANYGSGCDTSPNEYSDYMPIDMVSRMGRKFKPK